MSRTAFRTFMLVTMLGLFTLMIVFNSPTTAPYRICGLCAMASRDETLYPVDTSTTKDGKPDLHLQCRNSNLHSDSFFCGEEVKLVYDTPTHKLMIDGSYQGNICPYYTQDHCTKCNL